MGVDNLWQFLPGKYGNAFIKWKTQSREPVKTSKSTRMVLSTGPSEKHWCTGHLVLHAKHNEV